MTGNDLFYATVMICLCMLGATCGLSRGLMNVEDAIHGIGANCK